MEEEGQVSTISPELRQPSSLGHLAPRGLRAKMPGWGRHIPLQLTPQENLPEKLPMSNPVVLTLDTA